jgi:hypothetical protein
MWQHVASIGTPPAAFSSTQKKDTLRSSETSVYLYSLHDVSYQPDIPLDDHQIQSAVQPLSYTAKNSNRIYVQGGSNMTGTNCDFFTHKSSRSYLNHLVI